MFDRLVSAFSSFLVLAFLSVGVFGCSGEKTARVSGKVTYQDKAVTGGTVIFATEDGKKVERATIDPEGNYKADQIPFGTLKVGVQPVPLPPTSHMPKGAMPKGVELPSGNYGANQSAGTHVPIPKALQEPSTSKITINVDSADKKFDITLK